MHVFGAVVVGPRPWEDGGVIRIRLTAADLADVHLASSALVEISSSLRTLADPQRHDQHREWVRTVRATGAGRGLSLAEALHEPGRYVPDCLTPRPPPGGPATLPRELAGLM